MVLWAFCFFQAEDGIRDLVRSRGLGDVYKRQEFIVIKGDGTDAFEVSHDFVSDDEAEDFVERIRDCLLYTSDAAERSTLCRSRWSPYP